MFFAEGSLKVRENPNQYIGKYGFSYNDGVSALKVTGSRYLVNSAFKRLLGRIDVPENMRPEEIMDAEQAKKYADEKDRSFAIVRFKEFDLLEKIGKRINDGEELLGGAVRLWEETRVPTPYVYCYAAGKLLMEAAYDQEQGWHQADTPHIERRQFGLMTPGLSLAVTATLSERW